MTDERAKRACLYWSWRGIAACVLFIVLSSCSLPATSPGEPGEGASETAETTQVQRASIMSVVVVDGVVSANPAFVVQAPESGTVHFDSAVLKAAESLTGVDATPLSVENGASLGSVAGIGFTSPSLGQVTGVFVGDGAFVAAKVPLVGIRYSGYGVYATVPVDEQYRLYEGAMNARVNVVGGPAGLGCQIVPLPPGQYPAGNGGSGVPVACLLPLDAAVVDGLVAKMGLTTAQRDNVPSLPVQAVSGRVGQGEVTLVSPDGSHKVVSVGLGVTDGSRIEITEGLVEGDTVLAHAPGIGR